MGLAAILGGSLGSDLWPLVAEMFTPGLGGGQGLAEVGVACSFLMLDFTAGPLAS